MTMTDLLQDIAIFALGLGSILHTWQHWRYHR